MRWVEQRKVGDQSVEEGGGERMLRSKTIADREDTTIGQVSEVGCGGPMGARVHQVQCPTMEVK